MTGFITLLTRSVTSGICGVGLCVKFHGPGGIPALVRSAVLPTTRPAWRGETRDLTGLPGWACPSDDASLVPDLRTQVEAFPSRCAGGGVWSRWPVAVAEGVTWGEGCERESDGFSPRRRPQTFLGRAANHPVGVSGVYPKLDLRLSQEPVKRVTRSADAKPWQSRPIVLSSTAAHTTKKGGPAAAGKPRQGQGGAGQDAPAVCFSQCSVHRSSIRLNSSGGIFRIRWYAASSPLS